MLAKWARRCDGVDVDRSHQEAAGSLLAISIIAGVVGGVVAGQPSIGFLVGSAFGLALTAIWWLRDRSR